MKNQEIEVRFLEIDKEQIIEKLLKLGATDLGEDFLREIIFTDKGNTYPSQGKVIRIRQTKNGSTLTFKHHFENSVTGATEIEFEIGDINKACDFLEAVDLKFARTQEKKRHSFKLKNVTLDIDEWPTIPAYIELEGESEQDLKEVAKLLDLDWGKVILENAKIVIEKYYKIPVTSLTKFTFDVIE